MPYVYPTSQKRTKPINSQLLLVCLWEAGSLNNKYDYQRPVVPAMILMITGSLSKDVFEQRLSTRSRQFTSLSGFVQILRQIISTEVKKLSSRNLIALRRNNKKEK